MHYDGTIDNVQNEFLEKQNIFFRNCYKNGTLTREEYATYKKLENIVALTQIACFATPFIVLFIIGMIIGFPLLGAFGIFFAFIAFGVSGLTRSGRQWAAINVFYKDIQNQAKKSNEITINFDELKEILSEDGYLLSSTNNAYGLIFIGTIPILVFMIAVLASFYK
ncbi:hypothetical protein [Pseudobutyrivibrio sp.]|uniref:hypothetical protein n=1 Tax=Pseudobutyrivibrio sp. TaxID=2014367 RepID=UPI001D5A3205|nr:hypothetical protein [Pseudobutyrivibrio sp.]MBE5911208.1 hypothetical protein [Pseudobutyrivibrio sp.]